MLSTVQFRYRFHPLLALLVGSVVALSTFTVLYSTDAYRAAQRCVATNTATDLKSVAAMPSGPTLQPTFNLDGSRPDAPLSTKILEANKNTPERASRVLKMEECTHLPITLVDEHLELIEQEFVKKDFDLDRFTRENPVISRWLTENPELAALAKNNPWNRMMERISTYIAPGLFAGITALLLTSIWSWVATFPRLGWRRFALILGAITGAVAGIAVWWLDEYKLQVGVTVVIVSATCVAVGLLIGLKTFEWVRHGFDVDDKGKA